MGMIPTHKVGQHILFSSGSYSDYSPSGIYRVLVDFDIEEVEAARMLIPKTLFKQYTDVPTERQASYMFTRICTEAYLITRGLVEEIEYHEINTDGEGYGDYRKEYFTVPSFIQEMQERRKANQPLPAPPAPEESQ